MLALAGVTLQWQWLEQAMLTIIHAIGQVNGIALASLATATVAVIAGVACNGAAATTSRHVVLQPRLAGLCVTDPGAG